jgi:hypothetical protein
MCDEDVAAIVIDNGSGKIIREMHSGKCSFK